MKRAVQDEERPKLTAVICAAARLIEIEQGTYGVASYPDVAQSCVPTQAIPEEGGQQLGEPDLERDAEALLWARENGIRDASPQHSLQDVLAFTAPHPECCRQTAGEFHQRVIE